MLSSKTKEIVAQISLKTTQLGDLRTVAKNIKKDHQLAMELWSTNEFMAQLLAILIMDNKMLSQEVIDALDQDMQRHTQEERNQLMDWLMANQLMKDKKCCALMESWEKSTSALQRRVFWYFQARLRWMGNTNHSNTEVLISTIEKNLLNEQPEVQWAMNYTAGQIGKWEEKHRKRCILIGEDTGLYKDEVVSKGCTSNYLPLFITMEVAKMKK